MLMLNTRKADAAIAEDRREREERNMLEQLAALRYAANVGPEDDDEDEDDETFRE